MLLVANNAIFSAIVFAKNDNGSRRNCRCLDGHWNVEQLKKAIELNEATVKSLPLQNQSTSMCKDTC